MIHRDRDGRTVAEKAGIEVTIRSFTAELPARDIELVERVRFANLEATRGCNRKCTFCHVPTMSLAGAGRILRREVADVVEEMRMLNRMGKSYLIFNDSILGGSGGQGIEWLSAF